MKKVIVSITVFFFLWVKSQSQITKGNWLMGGNADFASTKGESSSMTGTGNSKRTNLRISPKIGYFVIDKLAFGIGGVINYEKVSFNSSNPSKQSYYSIGPIARYYFLQEEKQVNIFSELSYFYLISKPGNQGSNSYYFTLGAVIFLTTSVGLELIGSYSITNDNSSDLTYKMFQVGLGFQIHLEKDKP